MPDQSANLSTQAAANHQSGVKFSWFKGAVKASGSLTATPTYPTQNVSVSYSVGSESDVVRGMRVRFYTSGGVFKGASHVRGAGSISSSNLPIRETGSAKLHLVSGDLFEVLEEFPLVDKLVSGDLFGNEVFSPDGLAYTDEGTDPDPVVCSGGHWAGEVDDGETYATVLMNGALTFSPDPDNVSGFTHLWTLPSGVAFHSGSADSDVNPTLEVNAGRYIVRHTVTDNDSGKSRTQYVCLICDDGTDTYAAPVIEDSWSVDGTENELTSAYSSASLDLASLPSLDDLPDGSLGILWAHQETLQTTTGMTTPTYRGATAGRWHILHVGIVRRDNSEGSDSGTKLHLDVISPFQRLAEIVSYSKVMIEAASPSEWAEVETGLTFFQAMTRLLLYYTTLVESGFDWIELSSSYDKAYSGFSLQKSTFLTQLIELAAGIDCRVVVDRAGRFEVGPHPVLLHESSRSGTVVTQTYTDRHLRKGYTVGRQQWEPLESCIIRGLTAGSSPQPVAAIYPSNSPGMGTDAPTVERCVFDDVDDAKERVGRYGAYYDGVYVDSSKVRRIAPTVDGKLRGAYDHFDFYNNEYQELDLEDARIDLTDFLFYVRRWSTRGRRGGTFEVNVTWGAATNAGAGESFNETSDTVSPITLPPVDTPPPVTQPDPLHKGIGNIIVIGSNNVAPVTSDFSSSLPDWATVSLSPGSGNNRQAEAYANSPLYLGAGNTVNGCIASTTHVAKVTDWFNRAGSRAVGTAYNHGAAASVHMRFERGDPLWGVLIRYETSGGTKCAYTTDGGVNWSGSTVSATVESGGTSGSIWVGGIFASMTHPGYAYTTAFNSGSDADGYYTTDYGATWTQITGAATNVPNIDPGVVPSGSIAMPITDTTHNRAVYGGATAGASAGIPDLRRTVDSTTDDISPSVSGKSYGTNWGLVGSRQIAICDEDPNSAILCGMYHDGTNLAGHFAFRVLLTRNLWAASPSWTALTSEVTTQVYTGCYFTHYNTAFLFGLSGAVAYWDGTTVYDKTGDIASLSPGTICGLIGG